MRKGIAASPGYAAERVFLLRENELVIPTHTIEAAQAASEQMRLRAALDHVKAELARTRDEVLHRLGEEECAIFDSHLMMLDDPSLLAEMETAITDHHHNSIYAAHSVFSTHASFFEQLEDEYLRERAADFKDLRERVTSFMLGVSDKRLEQIESPIILVAHDLTPSQTARLNPALIKGIVTEIGGTTSHSAILARTLEIPAVVGCGEIHSELTDGMVLALDGFTGELIFSPDAEQVKRFQKQQDDYRKERASLREAAHVPAITRDGKPIEVAGNIGKPEEVSAVLANGGDGVGLFRSEFLFLERDTMPGEEEQFQAYARVARELDGRPVIIRTLDIGGDKQLPYLAMEREENPFLGFRAIRLCLEATALFLTQLRAILRASAHGKVRVMFPMIATETELKQALALLGQAKEELRAKGIPFDEQIETGIMIEVPSAALIADQLAPYVDFFSIGSNDLIQYTFAADRMNQKLGYLYDPSHPAILRLIDRVVKEAHARGKWVGVCGEMAGDPVHARALIALGVDELSMTPTLIPQIKRDILQMESNTL